MDSEPSPINWIDDSSKPPGSFVDHQGFALVKLDEVCARLFSQQMPERGSFYFRPNSTLHTKGRHIKEVQKCTVSVIV